MPEPDAPLRALTCNAPVVEMRAGGYAHGPEGIPWTRGGWARWLNDPARTPKLAEEDGSHRGGRTRVWRARGARRGRRPAGSAGDDEEAGHPDPLARVRPAVRPRERRHPPADRCDPDAVLVLELHHAAGSARGRD